MENKHHENIVNNLGIGVRFYESTVDKSGYVPFHWHSSIEIICVLSGELVFRFDGRIHVIGPGEFVVVPSGVIHDVTNSPNQSLVLQIPLNFISPYYDNPELLNFKVEKNAIHTVHYENIVNSFAKLNHIYASKVEGYSFFCGSIVLLMLQNLIANFVDKTGLVEPISSKLKEIIIFINEHYSDTFNVEQLADQFGYNSSYLSRMFKNQMGLSIIQYVYKIRINYMYQDLLNTGTPIKNIMKNHGLTNERTTREMFKNMYQKTPREVRKDHGQ